MWIKLVKTVITCSIILLLLSISSFPQPAAASVGEMEEAPGQMLYKSRHTLRDNVGNSWQVILFKRVKSDGSVTINLRLVDFPGRAEFAHPQPLTISIASGEIFSAEDMFADQAPGTNVGQYNLKNVLNQLPSNLSPTLSLPLENKQMIEIKIPSVVILEWQTIATINQE